MAKSPASEAAQADTTPEASFPTIKLSFQVTVNSEKGTLQLEVPATFDGLSAAYADEKVVVSHFHRSALSQGRSWAKARSGNLKSFAELEKLWTAEFETTALGARASTGGKKAAVAEAKALRDRIKSGTLTPEEEAEARSQIMALIDRL